MLRTKLWSSEVQQSLLPTEPSPLPTVIPYYYKYFMLGMLAHTYHTSAWEVRTGGSRIQSYFLVHSKKTVLRVKALFAKPSNLSLITDIHICERREPTPTSHLALICKLLHAYPHTNACTHLHKCMHTPTQMHTHTK